MGLSNYLPSSRISQSGVCTSTTRPASPYEGQVIYETDTNKTFVWSGSAWVMLVSADSPPGLELVKVQTIGSSVATITVTNCFSSTYDDYRIIISNSVCNVSDYSWAIQLNNSTGSTYNMMAYYGDFGGTTNNAHRYANSSVGLYMGFSSSTTTTYSLEVYNPYQSAYTRSSHSVAGNGYATFGASLDKNAVSHTGFTVQSDHPTPRLTGGTIRVYGYRNSI